MPVRTGITGETSSPSGVAGFFGIGQGYKPALGSVGKWLGTGPNPGSAAGSTTASGAGAAQLVKKGC